MSKQIETKLLVIGSGPAGATAAIYAARAGFSPIMVCGMQPGGQLTITTEVENFPGFPTSILGPELMQRMEDQARNVGTVIDYDYIHKVDFSTRPYRCYGDSGNVYFAQTIVISTGAETKWLGLESEDKYKGFGVSSCATCDAPFYKGKIVAVVGGGNSAVEEAIYLARHASKVFLIHRRDSLRAEKILQQRLFDNPKIEFIWNSEVLEVLGTDKPKSVTGIQIYNNQTQDKTNLDVDGLFVAIGHYPNTKIFKDFINLDDEGYIITQNTKTNIEGVFAAGDVQDKIYRQAITAAASGCMAALEAQAFLEIHR